MQEDFKNSSSQSLTHKDTVYIREIETKVYQSITLKCLSNIEGIGLIEGNFIDHLLGREGLERNKYIHIEQDAKNHSLTVKIELNVAYGICIPEKADEIQYKIVNDIQKLTGTLVTSVHIVFKSLLPDEDLEKILSNQMEQSTDSVNEFFNEFSEEYE